MARNFAGSFGAGICGGLGGADVVANTVVGNLTSNGLRHGAGIQAGSDALVLNNIAVGNGSFGMFTAGYGILASEEVRCNDSWGNAAGDQWTEDGGFSEDPLFCDEIDYRIRSDSPCARRWSEGCGVMGARGVGCGPVPVRATTWGKLKAGGGEDHRRE